MKCACECHDGVKVFCSCWVPCCREPKTPREELGPKYIPSLPDVKAEDFMNFTFPIIRYKMKKLDINF